MREHVLNVPLDYSKPDGESLDLFVRELVPASKADDESLPYLLYLQGGPGFPSGRPTCPPSGWQKAALAASYRVLLLDQRGTGRSSPVTAQALAACSSPSEQAEYLTHFRATSIVRDCEAVKESLAGGNKLTLLGQSYGGFCILSYLSLFPESIERAIFTCGLAPVGRSADDVYRATYKRMEERCTRFYERYPENIERKLSCIYIMRPRALHAPPPRAQMPPSHGLSLPRCCLRSSSSWSDHLACDPRPYCVRLPMLPTLVAHAFHGHDDGAVVRDIVRTLDESPVALPRGGTLTVRRFLQLGLLLGSGSGFETLHNLLELARTRVASKLPEHFLLAVEAAQEQFETNPIYWLLHESIYCDGTGTGPGQGASRWAAERVQAEMGEGWDYRKRLSAGSEPINLTGEMVYSWMGEDYAWLRPLKPCAELLAAKEDWPKLYDVPTLGSARCPPVAALVSYVSGGRAPSRQALRAKRCVRSVAAQHTPVARWPRELPPRG